ncbi:MAG: DUF2784 domain-containing protein [Pseudomonadota bacterium]
MNAVVGYAVAADVVLALHVSVVVFVVLGLLLVLLGWAMGWQWIRNPWFRLTHLACIAVVAVQSWFGIVCPLTTLEMYFRRLAGEATYSGSFIGHWLNSLLYYQAPWWIFMLVYTLFGSLVVATWIWVRPNAFRGGDAPAIAVQQTELSD